jgi:hypothetical protein
MGWQGASVPSSSRPPTKNEERALSLGRERLRTLAPQDMAQRSGASLQALGAAGSVLTLSCLGRSYDVHYPEGTAWYAEAEEPTPPRPAIHILLLHYLAQADGAPLAGRWVAFRELPDGLIYDQAFRARVEPPLLAAFAARLGHFATAAQALSGTELAFGDMAFEFRALPRLPLAAILHAGDEELPPTANILFDATAGHYLPTEDLAILGGLLVGALLRGG